MLAKVIDIAVLAHQNRIDKSGHQEILHPLRVGMKRDHSGISEKDLDRMMAKYDMVLKRMEGLL